MILAATGTLPNAQAKSGIENYFARVVCSPTFYFLLLCRERASKIKTAEDLNERGNKMVGKNSSNEPRP